MSMHDLSLIVRLFVNNFGVISPHQLDLSVLYICLSSFLLDCVAIELDKSNVSISQRARWAIPILLRQQQLHK